MKMDPETSGEFSCVDFVTPQRFYTGGAQASSHLNNRTKETGTCAQCLRKRANSSDLCSRADPESSSRVKECPPFQRFDGVMASRTPAQFKAKAKRAPQPPPRTVRTGAAAVQNQLSLVATFDELTRNCKVLSDGAEMEFGDFVDKAIAWTRGWREAEKTRIHMSEELRERDRELVAKDYKIKQARKIVEDERRGRLQAEAERDDLLTKLQTLKHILLSEGGGGRLDNETLERVRTLDTLPRRQSPIKEPQLAALEESEGSIIDASDFSFDDTRGDLGESRRAKRRSSGAAAHAAAAAATVAQKRRKSRSIGGHLDADTNRQVLSTTTKLTVDPEGNAHAESIIEAVPVADLRKKARKSRESRGERRVTYNERQLAQEFSPSAPPMHQYNDDYNQSPLMVRRNLSNASNVMHRPHIWQQKRAIGPMVDKCQPCGKRFKFSMNCLKCRNCASICHVECKNEVPVPCAALTVRTPTNKATGNYLADFTPSDPPMIPPMLIHCLREIELRGLEETGIYRLSGSQSDAKEVLQKFMRGRGTPSLHGIDVHVIVSAVKNFLRSLREPVIPASQWRQFVDAATNPDTTDGEAALCQAVSEMPRPNRDTLAFMILHFQKVTESPACKMDSNNLAIVFGPTIVGFSSSDPSGFEAAPPLQQAVFKALLSMSSDYWANFLQTDCNNLLPPVHTPEVVSERPPLPPSTLKSVGPVARRTRSRQLAKKQRFFESPMLGD